MHMLNFRHTGGSLHNVWVWGCPARGDGGEADVLSALLHSPVLSWWGESPAEGGCGGEREEEEEGRRSGRIEKLRRGGSSGELPIDMQREQWEKLTLSIICCICTAQTVPAYVLQCLNAARREVTALRLHFCVIWYLISVRSCDSIVWFASVCPQL